MTVDELEQEYTNRLEQLKHELENRILPLQDEDQFFAEAADLEDDLTQYVVLYEGTPRGLAEFAAKSLEHHQLIETFLQNATLRREILLADSPKAPQHGRTFCWKPAQYGPALAIFQEIQTMSDNAKTGILKRLALAVALEHAVPLPQNNPKLGAEDADAFVDPVRRYLNYEMAYEQGQLDPAFDTLSTWELRHVVDGDEPDEIAEWGRRMLSNYRPDHVLSGNYSKMVNTNIRYGSQQVKNDRPELQLYQNILMNGGVCGRRAFFGRFLLRAFGIPTTARPSKGHGALCHWTPKGWVVGLGPGWGKGWTKTRYKNDLDFLATTQARGGNPDAYWNVKRAQWMGDVLEEPRIYGETEGKLVKGFWYGRSLQLQKTLLEGLSGKASPRHCPSDHKPTIAEQVESTPAPPNAKTITYDHNSEVLTIPVAAFSHPKRTKDVHIMKSFLEPGGFQVYLPDFLPQGLTLLRGGTWKNNPMKCCSGARLKSGGYGKYEDWGFRIAVSGPDDPNVCPNPHMTIELEAGSGVTMDMVYIPPGTSVLGGENPIDGRFDCVEVPKHPVTLTKGFYLGKYPVTQEQYQVIVGANPSKSTKAPTCPVDNIGESDALDYCKKLVETIGKDFRLPTEAEWEYAARGGQGDKKWFFGDDPSQLGEFAWFKDNAGGKSHPVGQKKPNPFGIYDIYGNVYERVNDKYDKDYYSKSPMTDPTGPLQGTKSTFEYSISVPRAGNYLLGAQVVTANSGQRLNVCATGDEASEVVLELPFTNGYWQTSTWTLPLKEGSNTIRFWRDKPPQYGITIKGFTLKPFN